MPIPITALRRLYEFMGAATSSNFHRALAAELCRKPQVLVDLVENSWGHFSTYSNPGVAFHDRPPFGEPLPAVYENNAATCRLVVTLHQKAMRFQDELLAFEYVDYEVCPNRTRNHAVFEDGTSRRGSPMDLLLRCPSSHLPIIGEVKNAALGNEDKNALFALIQGLMYSVELLTSNQRLRLAEIYADEEGRPRFSNPTEGPYGDLYLILINHPEGGGWRHELLERTDQLAGSMMRETNAVTRLLRRIVCLNAKLVPEGAGEQANFNTLFVHSSCST